MKNKVDIRDPHVVFLLCLTSTSRKLKKILGATLLGLFCILRYNISFLQELVTKKKNLNKTKLNKGLPSFCSRTHPDRNPSPDPQCST